MQICEAVDLGFFNGPFEGGIVFFQLLEQYTEARAGFYLCFHHESFM